MCTLRNFPHLIDHCIEWSRASFEDTFVCPAQSANKFLADAASFIQKQRNEVIHKRDAQKVYKTSQEILALKCFLEIQAKGPTIDDCVTMAYQLFHELFIFKIQDLVKLFPVDAKTQDGEPFWQGHKKFPQAVEYAPDNPHHVGFVVATANLYASMFKIHPPKPPSEQNDPEHRWMAEYRDVMWLNRTIAGLEKPKYQPGTVDDLGDLAHGGAERDAQAEMDGHFNKLEELLLELAMLAETRSSDRFEPLDFEKDDDDNFHIDFITCCSNLRAYNYHIPAADRHKCKMIAGRIIPAIAATTAAVTGLVLLEMYKVLQQKPVEQLRNGNFSLGSNSYMMFEAEPPKSHTEHVALVAPDPAEHPDAYDEKGNIVEMYKDPDMMLGFAERVKYFPDPQTKYDKIWIDGCKYDMTVQELVTAINNTFQEHGLTCHMLSCPQQTIECERTDGNPKGLTASRRQLWNKQLPGTQDRLGKSLALTLSELTTRSEGYLTVDEPIDITDRKLWDGLDIGMRDADGVDVVTPVIVLNFVKFEFVPYPKRKPKHIDPWLP